MTQRMRLDANEDMDGGEVEGLLSLEWESSEKKTDDRVRFLTFVRGTFLGFSFN